MYQILAKEDYQIYSIIEGDSSWLSEWPLSEESWCGFNCPTFCFAESRSSSGAEAKDKLIAGSYLRRNGPKGCISSDLRIIQVAGL